MGAGAGASVGALARWRTTQSRYEYINQRLGVLGEVVRFGRNQPLVHETDHIGVQRLHREVGVGVGRKLSELDGSFEQTLDLRMTLVAAFVFTREYFREFARFFALVKQDVEHRVLDRKSVV